MANIRNSSFNYDHSWEVHGIIMGIVCIFILPILVFLLSEEKNLKIKNVRIFIALLGLFSILMTVYACLIVWNVNEVQWDIKRTHVCLGLSFYFLFLFGFFCFLSVWKEKLKIETKLTFILRFFSKFLIKISTALGWSSVLNATFSLEGNDILSDGWFNFALIISILWIVLFIIRHVMILLFNSKLFPSSENILRDLFFSFFICFTEKSNKVMDTANVKNDGGVISKTFNRSCKLSQRLSQTFSFSQLDLTRASISLDMNEKPDLSLDDEEYILLRLRKKFVRVEVNNPLIEILDFNYEPSSKSFIWFIKRYDESVLYNNQEEEDCDDGYQESVSRSNRFSEVAYSKSKNSSLPSQFHHSKSPSKDQSKTYEKQFINGWFDYMEDAH